MPAVIDGGVQAYQLQGTAEQEAKAKLVRAAAGGAAAVAAGAPATPLEGEAAGLEVQLEQEPKKDA